MANTSYIETEVKTINIFAEKKGISIDEAVQFFYEKYAGAYESEFKAYQGDLSKFPDYFYNKYETQADKT